VIFVQQFILNKFMRNLILFVCCALGLAPTAVYPQGTIMFNNLSNTDQSPAATTGGLVFYLDPSTPYSLLNKDVNFVLLAGPSLSQQQVIHTWLVGDGSARGIVTGPGHFADPTGRIFTIPGIAAGGTAFLTIDAWAGNYPTGLDAMWAGAPVGSVSFGTTTGGAGAPPPSLVWMPAFVISVIPEPSVLAIGLAGGILLTLHRRNLLRRRQTS
jgi:hypothetical protein